MENMQGLEITQCTLGLLYFLLPYLLYNQCNKHNAVTPILLQPGVSNLAKNYV